MLVCGARGYKFDPYQSPSKKMKRVINFVDKLTNPIFLSSMAIKPKYKECYDLIDIRKYTYVKRNHY